MKISWLLTISKEHSRMLENYCINTWNPKYNYRYTWDDGDYNSLEGSREIDSLAVNMRREERELLRSNLWERNLIKKMEDEDKHSDKRGA
jgi:hypothetical protein